MRGHIFKRGKTYSIVLSLGRDPVTGKRKQQWVSGIKTKHKAEEKLNELLHQIETGFLLQPGKTTLAEYLTAWLNDYARANLSPRTVEGYISIIDCHLIPELGNVILTQLRPEQIQQFYQKKLSEGRYDGHGGLSAQTVRRIHSVLHKALQNALKTGFLSRNPADAVTLPRSQRPELHIMSEEDAQEFLESAKSSMYYPVFYLALYSGMRRSEMLALRWSDIDILLGQVYVSKSLHQLHTREIVFRSTKSAKSRRQISLSPSTIRVLREHRKVQEGYRTALGSTLEDNDLVFSQPDGKAWLPDTISHVWVKIIKKIGLKGIRFHDARHTHASLLLKQGVHPKIVQERLGHSSIQLTLDTYSHVAPGLQEAAALRFDEIMTPKREKDSFGNEGLQNVCKTVEQ